MPPRDHQKERAQTTEFRLSDALLFVGKATLNRLSGWAVPVFVRKRFVLSFLLGENMGESGTLSLHPEVVSDRAPGHPFAAEKFFENSLTHSLKRNVRCAPVRTGCAKGNDS